MSAASPDPSPEQLLNALCKSAELLSRATATPVRRMRIGYGEATVDVEWADLPAVGGAAVPARADVPAGADSPAVAPTDSRAFEIRAPAIGTFYRSPEPGAPAFIDVGDHVSKGQQIGILEIMKLMQPVEAEQPGTVTDILVDDGTAVEFDQPLFRLTPDLP